MVRSVPDFGIVHLATLLFLRGSTLSDAYGPPGHERPEKGITSVLQSAACTGVRNWQRVACTAMWAHALVGLVPTTIAEKACVRHQ